MVTITDLSIKVIYIILQQKIIDIKDVISFSLTCRLFHEALDNDLLALWQTKFYQRWPYLKKIYDRLIQNGESINFKDDVKASIKCRKELFSYLSLLSEKFFNIWQPSDSDIRNFHILLRLNIGAHAMDYHFLKDELLRQIKMSPFKILLPFLQRRHLEDVWLEFINYPKEQQLLENAATIVAQWYQPQKRIYNFDIEASLDDIAQQALNSLKKAHRDHPIFSTSAEQFSFWKYNNIDDNQWSKIEGKQIIDVLRTILFDELGFHLNRSFNVGMEWSIFKPEDIFIDCVLESKFGTDITLAIIFQSVARRLGVRCDLVHSAWLSWKPKSIAENPEEEECFYIDILHGGTIRGRRDCPIEHYSRFIKMAPIKMASYMNTKLQTDNFSNRNRTQQGLSLMELQYVIKPDDIDRTEMLYRNYFYNKMNMTDFLLSCQSIENNDNNRLPVEALRRIEDTNLQISRNSIMPKNRTQNLKYAIGLIVTCRIKNGPNQTGVIIGWDEKFNSHANIKYKYRIIPSCSQTCGTADQPFYIVLSEDFNAYYAAQDTLMVARPRWIEHSEIGRYFCRFADVYYVPNEGLAKRYPYDQAFLMMNY